VIEFPSLNSGMAETFALALVLIAGIALDIMRRFDAIKILSPIATIIKEQAK
jgi:hypothetical protein